MIVCECSTLMSEWLSQWTRTARWTALERTNLMDTFMGDCITDSHDAYGKRVLRAAFGARFSDTVTVDIDYGCGRPARIDGTIDNDIAVEVESRVSKQVRGAVVDLLCHPYPRKLLLLLPVHMANANTTAQQCACIFGKFLKPNDY